VRETVGQGEVLREIRKNGPMTVEELAEKLGINPNTVRTNLNGLYEWGLCRLRVWGRQYNANLQPHRRGEEKG